MVMRLLNNAVSPRGRRRRPSLVPAGGKLDLTHGIKGPYYY